MRCGVPLLNERVAPRCSAADALLVVTLDGGQVISQDFIPVWISGVFDLTDALRTHRIDTLICGGIGRDTKESVFSLGVEIIENVACPAEEIVPALESGALTSGFGLSAICPRSAAVEVGPSENSDLHLIDCLRCRDRVCLAGEGCPATPAEEFTSASPDARRMVETAFDIAQEQERQLCRVAEMVYFCLEMEYRRIGIAFCSELFEPARILASILRRFFEVTPVCCKLGAGSSLCNPLAQAEVLNQRRTDFNIMVGLCVGSDSIFAHASHAPISTLFVKDRSLANNPIGALYSDYYLHESVSPTAARDLAGTRQRSALVKEEI